MYLKGKITQFSMKGNYFLIPGIPIKDFPRSFTNWVSETRMKLYSMQIIIFFSKENN